MGFRCFLSSILRMGGECCFLRRSIGSNEFLGIDNSDVISVEDKKLLEIIKSNTSLLDLLNKVNK